MEWQALLWTDGAQQMTARKLRCAIYTRKSSDEGLEQEFNSLHAQRGSCEAYILSQAGEGWVALPIAYDDGGYSGGSMARPGLQQLLADIAAGRVDIIVVYKVDRLTRSLADFARIVECFDTENVSFVSVTQAFNTTTSMGRLTLNMLLSFAQFEREVTSERIRDKIAASKAKGLWMGGWAPLGYDGVGRKLEVNAVEAETVRSIFQRYLLLGSVRLLGRELDSEGVRSKHRTTKTGKHLGGALLDRGALYHMLSNPVYRGCIQHREKLYEGAHPPIIDDELWAAVQDKLAENTREKPSTPKLPASPLLPGRLFDDRGHAMTVVHTKKGSRRYRYYLSVAMNSSRSGEPGSVPRIAVGVLDGFVAKQLESRLSSGWLSNSPDEERLRSAIINVILSDDRVTISLNADAFQADLTIPSGRVRKIGDQAEIMIQTRLKHRKGAVHIEPAVGAISSGQFDKSLIRAVCLTRIWAERLARGDFKTITELAEHYGYWDHYVANLMPLAWLAPDLVEDILEGNQPAGLTLGKLKHRQLPMDWQAQRALFRNACSRH
jgi:site-specific DNA recombinase